MFDDKVNGRNNISDGISVLAINFIIRGSSGDARRSSSDSRWSVSPDDPSNIFGTDKHFQEPINMDDTLVVEVS